MPSATFIHQNPPLVNLAAGVATVSIYAEQTDPQVVILDDQDGDTHEVPIDPAGATDADKARPGTIARVVDIAGRRGLSIAAEDVSEVS
jgi:hypothetical protein